MRNSIQGPLLRTGHNSSFKALGETGYPVFKMAFQLREAIYRLDAGRDLARHLAIPQNDQGGDRTDWYSSFPGDVIPWSAANESERASARQQFDAFQVAVQALSEQMLNADQSGAGGDRRVFAQLLKSVVHFPDYDFVYLVNGVLVITFWGFIHQNGEQRAPMHWLAPSSVPQPTPLAASALPIAQAEVPRTATDIPVTETPTRTRRWNWRWLLWLLLALLLLALLLGLLRGCVPSVSLPGLPWLSGEKTHAQPAAAVDNQNAPELTTPARSDVNASTLTAEKSTVTGNAEIAQTAPDPATDIARSQTEGSNPVAADNTAAEDIAKPADAVPSVSQDVQSNESQPPATIPPVVPAQGKPLTLPPGLPDGPAQFLNGQWRANGGIQDKLTGRPLQLQYQFEQGKGTVSVRQSSGVTCTGAASGSVQKGTLSITNPEQMKCSDGSNFIVPAIECKSPASGHADCVGSNKGENAFPIRMLQPNN
ncbi:SrfA family protein [Erwinia sp. V71]|uniref:SrfA family protein n=1 Tax=Erwinia sp. V71 TaxID=3369424 RepID=UPI003F5E16E9